MRHVSGLVLAVATISLGGCVNSSFDSLSTQTTGCSTTTTSVACSTPTLAAPVTPAPNLPPPVAVTNPTSIATGDTTITLEKSVVNSPASGTTSLSQLINSPLTATLASAASQQITFNTNTPSNSTWLAPSALAYDDYGTCVYNGGIGASAGVCATGNGGSGLGGIGTNGLDPATHTSTGALTTAGSSTSLAGNYKQYRNYNKGASDQILQVWTWNNSYATQYRDVLASGTAPAHQAWSFGGNYTTAASMPTTGTATYAGQWGATATTSNWVDVTKPLAKGATAPIGAATVSANNNWQINGTSALTANFGTGAFYGYLTPRNWSGLNSTSGITNINIADAQANAAACFTGTCSLDHFNSWSNYQAYMSTTVVLQGNISKTQPNQIVGYTTLDPAVGWLTSTDPTGKTLPNPMYAGFFGGVSSGKPQEITGTFAVDGTQTDPNGGISPNNNNRYGYLSMSGIFNGQ